MNKITIRGGFHNVPEITVMVKNGRLSAGQYKRILAHLCGMSTCCCDKRDATVSGVRHSEFCEMLTDAQL